MTQTVRTFEARGFYQRRSATDQPYAIDTSTARAPCDIPHGCATTAAPGRRPHLTLRKRRLGARPILHRSDAHPVQRRGAGADRHDERVVTFAAQLVARAVPPSPASKSCPAAPPRRLMWGLPTSDASGGRGCGERVSRGRRRFDARRAAAGGAARARAGGGSLRRDGVLTDFGFRLRLSRRPRAWSRQLAAPVPRCRLRPLPAAGHDRLRRSTRPAGCAGRLIQIDRVGLERRFAGRRLRCSGAAELAIRPDSISGIRMMAAAISTAAPTRRSFTCSFHGRESIRGARDRESRES